MPEEALPTDGVASSPSTVPAAPTEPTAAQAEDARIEAMVQENLAPHLTPKPEDEAQTPATEQPEKPKEEPGEAPKPAETPEEGKGQETKKPAEAPAIPPKAEVVTSRLDRRVATLYQQRLLLSGEKEVPPLEAILEDLKRYPKDAKIQAMHAHRLEVNRLKGVSQDDGADGMEDEDREAIMDAEVAQRVAQERNAERERQVAQSFVEFINSHPELDESKKDFNPVLAKAVETLWNNGQGMLIQDAYTVVTSQIEAVKADAAQDQERNKQRALSGAVNPSSEVLPAASEEITWQGMARLMETDPEAWAERIRTGRIPK